MGIKLSPGDIHHLGLLPTIQWNIIWADLQRSSSFLMLLCHSLSHSITIQVSFPDNFFLFCIFPVFLKLLRLHPSSYLNHQFRFSQSIVRGITRCKKFNDDFESERKKDLLPRGWYSRGTVIIHLFHLPRKGTDEIAHKQVQLQHFIGRYKIDDS